MASCHHAEQPRGHLSGRSVESHASADRALAPRRRQDKYHDACHNLVLGIIMQNVIFHTACQLTNGCPAGERDPLFLIEKLSMVAIFGLWDLPFQSAGSTM